MSRKALALDVAHFVVFPLLTSSLLTWIASQIDPTLDTSRILLIFIVCFMMIAELPSPVKPLLHLIGRIRALIGNAQ